jgi:CubicO group peptidase (beta-lactamase class C family)
MKIPACAFFFICLGLIGQSQGSTHPNWDKTFDSISNNNPLPAFMVAAVNKDGVYYEYNHGKEIWTKEKPLDGNSIFRIYSMTKAIATVAALQLVEQGKITLDEPLDKLMPEMAGIPILNNDGSLVPAKNSITLRNLLTHTAGFAYYFDSYRLLHFKKPANWPYKDLPRIFEAGDAWFYGTSLDWAGAVIEKVSGEDLEHYLKEHVTGPLGMTRTFFTVPDSLVGQVVSFGNLSKNQFVIDSAMIIKKGGVRPEFYSAGGGLYSTLNDYATFLSCILNDGTLNGHRILQKSSIDMMFTNQIGDKVAHVEMITNTSPPNDSTLKYSGPMKFGLGFGILGNIYFWGGIANTYFSINRQSGKAVLFFSNTLPYGNIYCTSINEKAQALFYK